MAGARLLFSSGLAAAVAALLATPALGGGRLITVRTSGGSDVADAKNRPVSKVITLLKDMLQQLEKEAESDQEVYDKMACWCETNDKEKTKAIADAEARITDLTTKIEALTAGSARLGTEIKNLEKEVAKNQESLDQATALRQKQLAEFNGEEKDMLESISALKAALVVLSKHHSGALLQDKHEQEHEHAGGRLQGVAAITSTLRYQLQKHSKLLLGVISPSERRVVEGFLQAPEDYFDSSPTFKQSYTPQSGQIFGILKQMKATFEENLSASQKEEMENQKAYEDLKAAKEDEIKAGQSQLDVKTQELATTDMKNAEAKQDIEDTRNTLSADEQFLMTLKQKCQMTDQEWEARQKTRQDEMTAVSKALAILAGDDAHDLFTKTFNPAFVQRASSGAGARGPAAAAGGRRASASGLLALAARRLRSPRLAALAGRVQLDAFTKVKQAIDQMVAQLVKEKEDEIKHKDFCVGEFNTNELQTEKKAREKEDLVAKVEDLSMTIQELGKTIDGLKAGIAEMQVQLKRAGEDRETENKDFQMTVADQRETQKLLQQALQVLGDYYAKGSASLLQGKKKGAQEPAGPAPPGGFSGYSKNAGSGGVMALLQQIISDAKAMEKEAVQAEDDAQRAYEEFVKGTNASAEAANEDIVNKSKAKAQAEVDLVGAKEAKEGVLLELEQLSNYNSELHQSCDFLVKNFDLRQTARDEEVEALRQAKAILSGANFEALVQRA